MIPLKDDAPRLRTPYITYFLLIANALVFLVTLTNPDWFANQFGIVPARMSLVIHSGPGITPGVMRDYFPEWWHRYLWTHLPINSVSAFLPLLTHMFLHGSWLHIIFNMWALWIFGDNVEDYLGHFGYLVLYLLTGIIGALVHIAFNFGSPIPTVGASGAIAGVMGAYFVLFPKARVLTLVPFFFVFFVWLPAWIVLGYWFLAQFLSGAATSIATTSASTGGVAVWAHVGGFVAGLVAIKLLPVRTRRYHYGTWS